MLSCCLSRPAVEPAWAEGNATLTSTIPSVILTESASESESQIGGPSNESVNEFGIDHG